MQGQQRGVASLATLTGSHLLFLLHTTCPPAGPEARADRSHPLTPIVCLHPISARLQGQKRAVKSLTDGDVFGEVALLTKAPRQADCVAATKCASSSRSSQPPPLLPTMRPGQCPPLCPHTFRRTRLMCPPSARPAPPPLPPTSPHAPTPATRCKCLTLSRDAFERLMGPVEQSLAAQIKAYQASNAQVGGTQRRAATPLLVHSPA